MSGCGSCIGTSPTTQQTSKRFLTGHGFLIGCDMGAQVIDSDFQVIGADTGFHTADFKKCDSLDDQSIPAPKINVFILL